MCVATRCDFVVDATSSILMPPGRAPGADDLFLCQAQQPHIRCATRACCQVVVSGLMPAVGGKRCGALTVSEVGKCSHQASKRPWPR